MSVIPSPVFPVPPAGFLATVSSNRVSLSWNPAANASSYVLQRATSISGPYTAVYDPGWLSLFTDGPLAYNTTYYYEVASANLAGISTNSAPLAVTTGPAAPVLTALAGNAQVSLNWNASPGATNYVLESSTTSGGPYAPIVSTTNISDVNTNLINGATYYYVVYAVGPYGQSPLSVETNATPLAAPAGSWINTITASPQSWNVSGNWSGNAYPNGVQAVASINSAIPANQTINLNQAVTVGALNIGSPSDAAAFNVAGNGGTLTLDNTPGQAWLMQLPASKGDTISAPMTVNGRAPGDECFRQRPFALYQQHFRRDQRHHGGRQRDLVGTTSPERHQWSHGERQCDIGRHEHLRRQRHHSRWQPDGFRRNDQCSRQHDPVGNGSPASLRHDRRHQTANTLNLATIANSTGDRCHHRLGLGQFHQRQSRLRRQHHRPIDHQHHWRGRLRHPD